MSTPDLMKTPLYDWHDERGGRMVDFAGWSMPVLYSSIVEEHAATRASAGAFDISHMGRLRFDGTGAAAFLDRLLTRRVIGLSPGKIRYSLVTNEAGGILDDVLVYQLLERDGQPFHLLVVNASNREKIVAWVRRHLAEAHDVSFEDQTIATAMIAVQGPMALAIAQPVVESHLSGLDYYTGVSTRIDGQAGIVSRTGYTGEDGCELIVPAPAALQIWERLIAAGAKPVGLGARDTLRLEAAMPLYGHELSEQINPFQADLAFAVNFKDRDFIGKAAMMPLQNDPNQLKRIGLVLAGKRVPREHFAVLASDQTIGEVTSGTFSPTLQRPIAMAYVQPRFAAVGTQLFVDIRGSREPAGVVKLPFYSRPKTDAKTIGS